jgi:hypothetical protein
MSMLKKSILIFIFNKIEQPIYGSKEPEFINFMIPGIMVTIVFSLSIGMTSLMFVLEKKDGLLDRSAIAGTKNTRVL